MWVRRRQPWTSFFFPLPLEQKTALCFSSWLSAFQPGCCDRKEQTIIITFSSWSYGHLQNIVCFLWGEKLSFFWFSFSAFPPADMFQLSHFYDKISQSPVHFPLRIPLGFALLLKLEGWVDRSPYLNSLIWSHEIACWSLLQFDAHLCLYLYLAAF